MGLRFPMTGTALFRQLYTDTCILYFPFSFLILTLPALQKVLWIGKFKRQFEFRQLLPFSRREKGTYCCQGLSYSCCLATSPGYVWGSGWRCFLMYPLLPASELGSWLPYFLLGKNRGPGMQSRCSQCAPRSHSSVAKEFHIHCLKS